jgi:hypothetical protein
VTVVLFLVKVFMRSWISGNWELDLMSSGWGHAWAVASSASTSWDSCNAQRFPKTFLVELLLPVLWAPRLTTSHAPR